MSILSDNEIKSRCIRPKFVASRKTDNDETEYAMFHSVTKKQVEEQIELYNRSIFGVKNIEELAGRYPDEQRQEVINTFGSQFYTVREIKPDEDISDKWKPMIQPFVENSVKTFEDGRKIPSYGLGSYSYDVRLGRNFTLFKKDLLNQPTNHGEVYDVYLTEHYEDKIIDTAATNPTEGLMKEFKDVDYIIIPPGGFALGHTVECVDIPRNVLATCMAKSSIARQGLSAYVTPIEPEFYGYITIEMSNLTPHPIKVWAGIGIMALVFNTAENECEVSYADRGGKYQNQPALPVETVN